MENMPSDFDLICLCHWLLHQIVSIPYSGEFLRSGAEGIRTPDLLRAREALSQLSYGPAIVTLLAG